MTNIQNHFDNFLPLMFMAGIYVHIPYCKQKCNYCNFHFSVSQKYRKELVDALIAEIAMNHQYLKEEEIDTLYFGGGTPSLMSIKELDSIISEIKKHFSFNDSIELTLEANPDDLDPEFLDNLRSLGFNRLSIGIQSFIDSELKMMNRSHDAGQAVKAIENAIKSGFSDLSLDLIFGMPDSTMDTWKYNLENALDYAVPHYSIYNLTVEKKTVYDHMLRTGKVKALSNEEMAEQFLFTMDFMEQAGYEHYEISNYAKPARYSKHNTSYWLGLHYLGIGPAAHSYNSISRQWNIASNKKYIESIRENRLPFEMEILGMSDVYNEYILTGLRTQWGCKLSTIESFGKEYLTYFLKLVETEIRNGRVICNNDIYTLSRIGKLFADEVSSGLFYDQ